VLHTTNSFSENDVRAEWKCFLEITLCFVINRRGSKFMEINIKYTWVAWCKTRGNNNQ
jgi:hypothetical protein